MEKEVLQERYEALPKLTADSFPDKSFFSYEFGDSYEINKFTKKYLVQAIKNPGWVNEQIEEEDRVIIADAAEADPEELLENYSDHLHGLSSPDHVMRDLAIRALELLASDYPNLVFIRAGSMYDLEEPSEEDFSLGSILSMRYYLMSGQNSEPRKFPIISMVKVKDVIAAAINDRHFLQTEGTLEETDDFKLVLYRHPEISRSIFRSSSYEEMEVIQEQIKPKAIKMDET